MTGCFIEGMEKPQACATSFDEFCPFMVFDFYGHGKYCERTGRKVEYDELPEDCPIHEGEINGDSGCDRDSDSLCIHDMET